MYRILFGLAPSVVILAVFSWLVHVEGQSYRRRFQENAPSSSRNDWFTGRSLRLLTSLSVRCPRMIREGWSPTRVG